MRLTIAEASAPPVLRVHAFYGVSPQRWQRRHDAPDAGRRRRDVHRATDGRHRAARREAKAARR
jgi:hypothetical protein